MGAEVGAILVQPRPPDDAIRSRRYCSLWMNSNNLQTDLSCSSGLFWVRRRRVLQPSHPTSVRFGMSCWFQSPACGATFEGSSVCPFSSSHRPPFQALGSSHSSRGSHLRVFSCVFCPGTVTTDQLSCVYQDTMSPDAASASSRLSTYLTTLLQGTWVKT